MIPRAKRVKNEPLCLHTRRQATGSEQVPPTEVDPDTAEAAGTSDGTTPKVLISEDKKQYNKFNYTLRSGTAEVPLSRSP